MKAYKITTQILTAIILIAMFVTTFSSCKKNNDLVINDTYSNDVQKRIRESVAAQMKAEGGIPQIFTANQKINTVWKNKKGETVNPNNNFVSACNFNTPTFCDLVQYARVFQCAGTSLGGPGYLLQFEYRLSWDNNIVYSTTKGSSTAGSIQIVSDATNNVVKSYDLANAGEVIIVDEGVDPNNSNNHIFNVKFRTTDFTNDLVNTGYINGDINGTYTVKLAAQFYTDCTNGDEEYSLWLLPVTAYGMTGSSGEDACKRNEKGWFLQPGVIAPNKIGIVGYDALSLSCGYGGSFARPDLQEVEYSLNGGSPPWTAFSNTTASGFPINGSQYIRKDDVAESATIASGTYNIVIRYKNWKYFNSTSQWQIPTTSNACFSNHVVGNTSSTAYYTFAYEHFPNVIIP